MGDLPLTLDLLKRRAVTVFPDKQMVAFGPTGRVTTPYRFWGRRVDCIGSVLDELGVAADGRVASLCWSTVEHAELYFGVPSSGRTLHTLNPRFRPDQVARVLIEAEDEALFVHHSLAGIVDALAATDLPLRHVVIIDDTGHADGFELHLDAALHHYELLLAAATPQAATTSDERRAAVLCHTGGTTGDPKGILYSHRSLVLHAMALTAAGGVAIQERDIVFPIVPMFHANAVGFVHAAVGTGATLVLPGSDLSGPALADIIEREHVTVTCGVPTIWSAVLPEVAGRSLPALRTIISGASAVPPSLSEAYRERVGLPLTQIWGMTETSPYATIATVTSALAATSAEEAVGLRATVGLSVLGVEARVVDEQGAPVSADGATSGELQVRGPWVAAGYLGGRDPESFTTDGWLRTGDVATIDGHGYLRIVDRLKDVIKSGGEWISSIELELRLMAHPAIAEAAVVGVLDERWGERPVAYVVLTDREGPAPNDEELGTYLTETVPSWWVPDQFIVIDEIPKTSVGKFAKATLRERAATIDEEVSAEDGDR